MPLEERNRLKITMSEIQTNLKNFGTKLTEHISDQKETDKKVDDNFEKVFSKIDHLGDTFQGKIQDKADQKEVLVKFEEMERKYVTKESQWAEKFLTWAAMIIGSVVIVGVIGLMAAGYLHLNGKWDSYVLVKKVLFTIILGKKGNQALFRNQTI